MTADHKNQFDALFSLWDSMWKRIQERRVTEWRLTLTIWTGLAALGVLFLQKPFPLGNLTRAGNVLFCLGTVAGGVVLLRWHFCFLKDVGRRHDENRDFADDILKRMSTLQGLSEIQKTWKEMFDVPDKEERERRRKVGWLDWSRKVQFHVSVLLMISVLALVLLSYGFLDP